MSTASTPSSSAGASSPDVRFPLPPGQVTVTIPKSTYDIVTLADARPESVYEAWVDVWARKDLTRDYRADYEYYAPDGSIHLSIGVLSDT